MNELVEMLRQESGQCAEAFGPAHPNTHLLGTAGSSWVERTTVGQKFTAALKAVPEVIQSIVECASKTWKVEAPILLLTALHQLAAAGGRLHRVRRSYLGLSCPFSVLICSAQSNPGRCMELLAEPWLESYRLRLREHQQFGAQKIIREIGGTAGTHGRAARGHGLHPHPGAEDFLSTRFAVLSPNLVVHSPLPGRIMEALNTSHDRAVMSLEGGMDPLEELLQGGRKQTMELCRVLCLSWADIDLPTRGPIPSRGVVHLYWRTQMATARRMILGPHSPWRSAPPPVLLMRQESSPDFLEDLPGEAFGKWAALLKACHEARHKPAAKTVWELSEEAKLLWSTFHQELLAGVGECAPFPKAWFEWLPELMMRLALLLSVLQRTTPSLGSGKAMVEAGAVERACTLTWWLAHEHLECLKALRRPQAVEDPTEGCTSQGIDNIDEETLDAAILTKLRERGPMSPRELMRSFHKMTRATREKAVSRLLRAGSITKTPHETLQITQ